MRVELTYYKQSGKFYAKGVYATDQDNMIDIWEELDKMFKRGIRPGLTNSKFNSFHVLVAVPEYDGDPTKLIINKDMN